MKNNIKKYDNLHEEKFKKIKQCWNKNVIVFIGYASEDDYTYSCDDTNINGPITIYYKNDIFISQILRDIGVASSVSQANGSGWKIKAAVGHSELLLDGLKKTTFDRLWNKTNGDGIKPHLINIYKK